MLSPKLSKGSVTTAKRAHADPWNPRTTANPTVLPTDAAAAAVGGHGGRATAANARTDPDTVRVVLASDAPT